MAANPFSRGTSPGRARPPHRGSFTRGHPKHGGRKKGTRNAISTRVRTAVTAAAKRRLAKFSRHTWDPIMGLNPLIAEALEHQARFTAAGAPRLRSRIFTMKAFCEALSAVAMRAIKTDDFVDQDLVQCLTLLAIRDPSEFAKFLAITAPKQSYLTARPRGEVVVDPREAVNPGEYRRPAIPEWGLDFDLRSNSWIAAPVDQGLAPQDAWHQVCGSPRNPAPGWNWKFDSEQRRFFAIALRPKTPIPEWTQHFDPKRAAFIATPVDPGLNPDHLYHPEYGSPLLPRSGWRWEFNETTQRLLPTIADRPTYDEVRFGLPKVRRLYRWHPDDGHYSLLPDDHDWYQDSENLYDYDADGPFFKPY
jgi:hypothetical protein